MSAGILLTSSCSKESTDNTPEPHPVPYESLTATTSYFATFKGDDGTTTVSFSGQTTRKAMLKEMDSYLKSFSTGVLDAGKINDMFANTNTPFSDASLNSATDKTIISKTAQSFSAVDADAERNRFKTYFDSIAAVSAFAGQTAAQGVPGKLGNYLLSAKGFEYGQFIQKGLIGALMLDQICNIYLGTEKQSADNSTIVTDKNYTQLEHHWDEAYGYLTDNEYYPMPDPADASKWLESYLGSYARQVNGAYGDPSAIYMAFLKGRAAIVNKDDATRTAQIEIIRTALEKAVATVGISYLNKTKTATSDASRFHALSEGAGFIYALRFAYNAKISKAKSDELLNDLMSKADGFWSLTNDDIDAVRNQLADAFSISRDAVVNH